MNIEKLKKTVEKEDIKEFCNIFLELERDEILKLSGRVYDEIMELCSKLKGNEKLMRVEEFLPFLRDVGIEELINVEEGRSVLENALISKFYSDLFLSLSIKKNSSYAGTLLNKGISLRILAEQGVETKVNLKESLKCFDEAAQIFREEKSDLNYAQTLMNKGSSLTVLAEQGLDTQMNLKESLKCFEEAAQIFKKEKSDLKYALTLTNKGSSLAVFAEHGLETESNLKESLKCFDEAAQIFKREKSDLNYAQTLQGKGISIGILAKYGVEIENNLKESLKCFDEAAQIFKKEKSDLIYAETLRNKAVSLIALAQAGAETENNLKEAPKCFDEAAQIFKKEKSDLAYARTLMSRGIFFEVLTKYGVEVDNNLKESLKCYDKAAQIFKEEKSDLNYALTLTNKGKCLTVLAEHGLETERNLKEALKCFDEAAQIFKREKMDLAYALTLEGEGFRRVVLAYQGIETESNFERAIRNYINAEDIFYAESFSLMFVWTALNHGIALWWRYTETNEDSYLTDAIEILKKAREESVHVLHPKKERLTDLLIHIYDTLTDKRKASKKECYEELKQNLDELRTMIPEMREDLRRIDTKTDILIDYLQKINVSCNRIISDLEVGGVKLKEADKEELKTLADDLKRANDEQLANFTRELIKLLKNPILQKEIEKNAPKRLRSIVKKTFSDMTHILNELGIALGAAIIAEELLPNIEAIMHQITILSEISPAFASTLILIPLITFKVKTVK